MSADIGKNAAERALADKLLKELPERETLRLLREETTLLVLMVRVANQERRDEWAERMKVEDGELQFEEEETDENA